MEQYFDNIGNEIKIGDEVLILVPKSNASYRRGIIKDLKSYGSTYCQVLIEYDDGRLYCDTKHYWQRKGDKLKFKTKSTRVWRFQSDIIKFNPEYIE